MGFCGGFGRGGGVGAGGGAGVVLVGKETSSFKTKLLMLLTYSCISTLLSVLSATFPSLSDRDTASGSLELLKCLFMLSFFLFP